MAATGVMDQTNPNHPVREPTPGDALITENAFHAVPWPHVLLQCHRVMDAPYPAGLAPGLGWWACLSSGLAAAPWLGTLTPRTPVTDVPSGDHLSPDFSQDADWPA